MAPLADHEMPEGWHTIKSALLIELRTAATFALCEAAADALLHARLIGESIAREARLEYRLEHLGGASDRRAERPGRQWAPARHGETRGLSEDRVKETTNG